MLTKETVEMALGFIRAVKSNMDVYEPDYIDAFFAESHIDTRAEVLELVLEMVSNTIYPRITQEGGRFYCRFSDKDGVIFGVRRSSVDYEVNLEMRAFNGRLIDTITEIYIGK